MYHPPFRDFSAKTIDFLTKRNVTNTTKILLVYPDTSEIFKLLYHISSNTIGLPDDYPFEFRGSRFVAGHLDVNYVNGLVDLAGKVSMAAPSPGQ